MPGDGRSPHRGRKMFIHIRMTEREMQAVDALRERLQAQDRGHVVRIALEKLSKVKEVATKDQLIASAIDTLQAAMIAPADRPFVPPPPTVGRRRKKEAS